MTSSLPSLTPAVEIAGKQVRPWPWAVSNPPVFSFMRLGPDMAADDAGLFFALLADYNRIASEDIATLEEGVLAAEHLILPGGLVVAHGDLVIEPSCCCGLEDWRDWEQALTGQSPWLGHDPAPWVEVSGSTVCVWADGAEDAATDTYAISFERAHFETELARAGTHLRAFLKQFARWTQSVGFSHPERVCCKLDRSFAITAPL